MIEWERRVLLKHYLEQGLSRTAIARRLGVNRRTSLFPWWRFETNHRLRHRLWPKLTYQELELCEATRVTRRSDLVEEPWGIRYGLLVVLGYSRQPTAARRAFMPAADAPENTAQAPLVT